MARLIPKVNPSSIENSGERIVAQALVEQLPANCVVYHSYPWLRPQRHNVTNVEYLQPGEADFVLVHPERGVLILEVKGGTLTFESPTHRWIRQETKEEIKDPFRQAEENKWAILNAITSHPLFKGSPPPFTMGHAVAFPHARYSGQLPAHVQKTTLIDADDLVSLPNKIDHIFDAWCRVNNPHPLTDPEFNAILEALSPTFHLTPVLWRTLADQEEKLKRLTYDQERLLDWLVHQERAVVEGIAGSGKTILAFSQAQRFGRLGKRTLLVCYNRPLADWLQQQLPEQYQEQITISTYHQLCREMCRVAKLRFPASSFNQDFWDYEAPELLMQATDTLGDQSKFDAIVVDEGQDFHELWWMTLDKLYRSSAQTRPLYLFYDPKQNIYVERFALPERLAGPFPLTVNCRNTQHIASFIAEIAEIQPSVHSEAPQGVVPELVEAATLKDVIQETRARIQNWCLRERGGLALKQVAILIPTNQQDRWPDKFGNIQLVQDFDLWRQNQGVLLATHRRFKGLEADAIVLAGIPQDYQNPYYSRPDHYVAASRAKHLLTLIYQS